MSFPLISHEDKQLIFSFLAVYASKTRCQCRSLPPSDEAEYHLHAHPHLSSCLLHLKSKHCSFPSSEDPGQMPDDYTCNLFALGFYFSF